MVWVRIEDDFIDHPKVEAAGPLAAWLFVCGLCYANKQLTDGFISASRVKRLADVDDALALAGRLVDVGLWERAEGGYRIHDYAKYQPSSDEVKREREAAAQRQAEWRRRQAEARNGVTSGVTGGVTNNVSNGVSSGAPYPVPVKDPVNDPGVNHPPNPPPQAEGGTGKPRRRRRDEPVEIPMVPLEPADRERWTAALAYMERGGALDSLFTGLIVHLEPVARAVDGGGLLLRAPPNKRSDAVTFAHVVRNALEKVGDAAGSRATIVD